MNDYSISFKYESGEVDELQVSGINKDLALDMFYDLLSDMGIEEDVEITSVEEL